MRTNLRTLGPNEAKLVLALREEGQEIVSAGEIIERLGSETTGRNVIQTLLRKAWLTRLKPGRYLLLPPEHGPEQLGENNALALAASVIEPSYVGWWSAASYHGFTTQKPMTVTVATTRQLAPRVLEGTDVRFVTVTKRKFFGYRRYDLYGRGVTLSDPAKTIADCVDRPELCGGPAELARIIFGASSAVDADAVLTAAKRMGSTALLQRLGYLMDLADWPLAPDQRRDLHEAINPTARTTLGRKLRKEGDVGYVAEWGLFVHAREAELLADVPRRVGAH
ncbi:MAG TPA: type IV toxin-antitoxin system AbiEi family antitoxin [Allosphingosinicella sp.]|jgi:predicted transcriptional regulator of viral defense system|nr:type IV toxin-antitoxin system AbiEi family antitoxin [Allosphingosinicella sp.]